MQMQKNNQKDYGCMFSEYDGKLRPIFYIKSELWFKILELNGKEKHKVFDYLNEEKEETYILNINDMGLPVLPVTKSILTELINNSYDIENFDIKDLAEKYNLTEDYINTSKEFLNSELKNISIELMRYEIKKSMKNEKFSDSSSDEECEEK